MDNRPAAETDVEIDIGALLSSLIRKLPYLIIFIGVFSSGTYVLLGWIAPVYKSEATILIETGESDLTRTTQSGGGQTDTILDQQAITSQVQLIRSRDLAQTVAKKLDLAGRAEFDPALLKPSVVAGFLARFGLVSWPSGSSG